jgi:hypothetical protein
MINNDMELYDYYTYGDTDGYGQPQLSSSPIGQIKMAIYTTSQAIQDNINYKDSQYIGLTHANVNDSFVIDYDGERLKVLYVHPKGRLKQVFMKGM